MSALIFSSQKKKKKNDVIAEFKQNYYGSEWIMEEVNGRKDMKDEIIHCISKCTEIDKRGPMPFGFWCGRCRRLEFRETRSLRDDDRAFQGPGPVGPRRNYGVELVARMDCMEARSCPSTRVLWTPGGLWVPYYRGWTHKLAKRASHKKWPCSFKAGHGLSRWAVVWHGLQRVQQQKRQEQSKEVLAAG